MLDTEINEDTATGHKTRCNSDDDGNNANSDDDVDVIDDDSEDGFDSPALHMSFSGAGLGSAVRCCHIEFGFHLMLQKKNKKNAFFGNPTKDEQVICPGSEWDGQQSAIHRRPCGSCR